MSSKSQCYSYNKESLGFARLFGRNRTSRTAEGQTVTYEEDSVQIVNKITAIYETEP